MAVGRPYRVVIRTLAECETTGDAARQVEDPHVKVSLRGSDDGQPLVVGRKRRNHQTRIIRSSDRSKRTSGPIHPNELTALCDDCAVRQDSISRNREPASEEHRFRSNVWRYRNRFSAYCQMGLIESLSHEDALTWHQQKSRCMHSGYWIRKQPLRNTALKGRHKCTASIQSS